MKELSVEQKAKAYDEAKLRMSAAYNSNRCTIGFMNEIFPELKESEDEKIRKALIKYFTLSDDNADYQCCGVHYKDIVTWLEKQGEHANFRNKIQIGDKVTRNEDGVLVNLSQLKRIAKPAENKGKHNMGISETTKKKLEDNLNKALEKETPESCNEFLKKQGEQKPYASETMNEKEDFDNSFTRMMENEKKPWTEEDEKILSNIIKDLVHPCNEYIPDRIEYEIIWLKNRLKSLKSQSYWKPSDAQIASITCAVRKMKESSCYDSELVSLLNDLKKLKEE